MKTRLIIFIIILISSCSDRTRNISSYFKKTVYLSNPTRLKLPTNTLMNPTEILVIDTFLIVRDSYDECNISIYNLNTKKLIGRAVRTGKGPKEVLKIGGIIKGIRDKEVYLYDIQRSLLLSYNIDSICAGKTGWNKKIDLKRKKKEVVFFSACFISENRIIGTGICEKKRYMIADTSGNIIQYSLEYPYFTNEQNSNYIIKGFGYQCFLRSNHKNKRFVSATYNGDIIELGIYNTSNNSLSSIKVLGNRMMKYERNGRYVLNKDEEKGYSDLTVGDKYVYALYSGRTYNKYKLQVGYCKTIFVIDWEGNPIVRINTDKELKNIAINHKENKLYAIYENPEPQIIVYDISKVFKTL